MVEVTNINPIGNNRSSAYFDIEVGIDGVIATKNALIANYQIALMAPHPIIVAKMDPAAQDHAPVPFARINLNMPAEEHESGGDDVWAANLENEEPPVPD
ncbi:hypothetical protein LBMAG15_08740 [Actinomycetes bacterium]|nr:hypothetical protein LBMAG15_08740 [Actinomycetes bacterium]